VVESRDLFNDRKTQAATVPTVVCGILYAVKPLEDERALFGWNTWSVILYREPWLWVCLDHQGDVTTASSIAQCVVDQVRQHLAQQPRIPRHEHRVIGDDQAKIDVTLDRAWDPFLTDLACQYREVDRLECNSRHSLRVCARQ